MTLTGHFNAEMCFVRRFDWTRLRGFRRQVRESEERYSYIVSDKNVAHRLVAGDVNLLRIRGASLYKQR